MDNERTEEEAWKELDQYFEEKHKQKLIKQENSLWFWWWHGGDSYRWGWLSQKLFRRGMIFLIGGITFIVYIWADWIFKLPIQITVLLTILSFFVSIYIVYKICKFLRNKEKK
jgi:hypothetical protein